MIINKLLQLLGFLIASYLLSYIINLLTLRFAKSLGIRNKNDLTVRWANESKPSLGGISFYFVFLFSAIFFAIIYFEDHIFRNLEYLGLLGAGSLAFVLGITDDTFNTRPLIKLTTQIICGFIIAYTGTVIEITSIPSLNYFITVLWIVGLMNSLNMLDNMDGITATVSTTVLLTCLISSFILLDVNTNFWTIILVSQIGALLGFLRFNVHPSKMFMGDTGSMFIGLFVGFYSIKGLWSTTITQDYFSWIHVIAPLIALSPAIIDTLTVVFNRLRKGQSPAIGGKDHTTHHLVYSGKTDKQVWYIFLAISILSSIVALFISYMNKKEYFSANYLGILFFVFLFYWLYRNTIRYKIKDN
ncbi:MAG: MraY family glycosyltransferase [Lishizhenia sp.]